MPFWLLPNRSMWKQLSMHVRAFQSISAPKNNTYHALKQLIGAESMITKEGADWKAMRKRFNPGFQPQYIHSLSGSVISKTNIFVQRLESAAESGITFKLADYAKDLTTDIITQLTIAQDLNAQTTPDGHGEKAQLLDFLQLVDN